MKLTRLELTRKQFPFCLASHGGHGFASWAISLHPVLPSRQAGQGEESRVSGKPRLQSSSPLIEHLKAPQGRLGAWAMPGTTKEDGEMWWPHQTLEIRFNATYVTAGYMCSQIVFHQLLQTFLFFFCAWFEGNIAGPHIPAYCEHAWARRARESWT